MAIVKDEDGILNFDISLYSDIHNVTLPRFDEYLNFLNEPELADCIINKLGMITGTEFNGSFISSHEGKFRVITGKEFNPIIYRGQVNDYPFMPSSKRYELFDGNERVRHSIEWIKKNEFQRLISDTPYIKRAQKFNVLDFKYDIDLEAIAKSYDFVSEYLDVTRDLMIALFFAYTYYDIEQEKILPFTGFEYNTPYLYVGNIKELYEKAPDSVKNIGLQPMPKNYAQKTMSINVSENFDYIKSLFKKVELPKNPAVAKYVYNLFEGGKKLIPDDYASKYANQVKSAKTLQNDLFEKYCEDTQTDIEWLSEEYEKLGYDLVNYRRYVLEDAKTTINKEVDELIIPHLDDGYIFRGIKKN